MTNIDLEQDAKDYSESSQASNQATLENITKECNKLVNLELEIAELTSKLSTLQAEARNLSERTIPDMMDVVGIKMLKLSNEKKLEVVPVVSGSIGKGKADEAFAWLRNNGYGDLIKRNVSVEFGKGDDEKASKLKSLIEQAGYTTKDKSDVHHMTLIAWAKEQMSKGVKIPLETLGIWVGRRTKIS
jgi:hypothetical protein